MTDSKLPTDVSPQADHSRAEQTVDAGSEAETPGETPQPPKSISWASAGAWEFVDEKLQMLAAFDAARSKDRQRPVPTEHGNVGEAELRAWLHAFLPKRYGVCRGFILDKWSRDAPSLRHHDVIIYDAMSAPVVFIDENQDILPDRRNRAIPVRHVRAVFEVKSRLNGTTAKDACAKLSTLNDLKANFCPHFCCGYVFFEMDPDAECSPAALNNLLPVEPIVGLLGGTIFRGTGLSPDYTGDLRLEAAPVATDGTVGRNGPLSNGPFKYNMSRSVEWRRAETHALPVVLVTAHGSTTLADVNTAHHVMNLTWGRNAFAHFAFDLLERLDGATGGGRPSLDAPFISAAAVRPHRPSGQ